MNPNPYWDPCPHCKKLVHRAALKRHGDTCWTPKTLQRLYEIGDVTWEVNGCFIWHGRMHSGYGSHKDGFAHRLVLAVVAGPQPTAAHETCHTCDVRACVNPAHLYWGTRSDNMRDMVSRGRGGGYVSMTQEEREVTLAAARAAQRGRPRSQAWKDSVSRAMKAKPGRVQSDEEKAKRRATWQAKRDGRRD